MIRGQVLSVMARPHIEVARSVGVGDLRLMLVHLFPNVLPLVIILATIEIPLAITIEGFPELPGVWHPAAGAVLGAECSLQRRGSTCSWRHGWVLRPDLR